jgi:hypothetical protein
MEMLIDSVEVCFFFNKLRLSVCFVEFMSLRYVLVEDLDLSDLYDFLCSLEIAQ